MEEEEENLKDYYWMLQNFANGDSTFSFDKYWSLPVSFIVSSIKRAFDIHKNRTNIESRTLAQIATALYSFGGNNKVSLEMFLPYSVETEQAITKQTCLVFIDLYDEGLLPEKVLCSSDKYLNSIKKYQ